MAAGYVAFGATNAAKDYVATRRVVELVLSNARPTYEDLAKWADGAVQRLPEELPRDVATVRWPINHRTTTRTTARSRRERSGKAGSGPAARGARP